MQTFEGVSRIIADVLHCDLGSITPTTSPVSDLGADSLDLIDVQTQIEEVFNVECDDDAMEARTVGELAAYVAGRLSAHDDSTTSANSARLDAVVSR